MFFVEVRRFFLSKFLRFACRRVRFRPVFLPDLIPKRVVINGVEFLYKKRFVRVRSGLLVGGGCLVGAPRSIVGRRFFLTGVGGAEVRKTGLAKGRG